MPQGQALRGYKVKGYKGIQGEGYCFVRLLRLMIHILKDVCFFSVVRNPAVRAKPMDQLKKIQGEL